MPDTSWWVDSEELIDEQLDVISLEPEGNFLVGGPPGSARRVWSFSPASNMLAAGMLVTARTAL